ncbi:MAG: hypothetical protein WC511_00175 [Candidatus Pacearchaeota archaeon]
MEEKKEARYTVLITGKNTHFEVPINEFKDFENLDEILKILKKKLQNAR